MNKLWDIKLGLPWPLNLDHAHVKLSANSFLTQSNTAKYFLKLWEWD